MVIIDPPLEDITASSLARFVRSAQKLAGVSGQVDVLITGNRLMRALNRQFRRQNKATDVLSFPRTRGAGGDIAISAAIAAGNAVRYGHTPADELRILILHGMLHLAGYDHERDNGRMAAREDRLRARLRLPGTLIERSKTTSHREDILRLGPQDKLKARRKAPVKVKSKHHSDGGTQRASRRSS